MPRAKRNSERNKRFAEGKWKGSRVDEVKVCSCERRQKKEKRKKHVQQKV